MSKFLSGRLRRLLVGITGYTENKTVVQTTGKVGIGTTDAQQHSLFVVGSTNITGDTIVGGGLTAVGIGSFQNDVYIDQQLYVGGVEVSGSGGNSFAGITTFTDTTDNTLGDPDTGAVQIDGGLGVNKNVTVGAGLSVVSGFNVAGVSTFTNDIHVNRTTGSARNITFYDNSSVKRGAITQADTRLEVEGTNELVLSSNSDVKILDRAFRTNRGVFKDTSVELYYNGSKKFETTGIGVSIYNGTSDTATIAGPANLIIDPGTVGDDTGLVRIKGDLYVDGTEFIVNSSTIDLADLKVGIATTVTSNLLLDGGGIAIGDPSIEKTLLWNNSNSRMEFNADLYAPNFTTGNINLSNLYVSGLSTFVGNIDANGDLDVDGHTELDQLNVSGLSTFNGTTEVKNSSFKVTNSSASGQYLEIVQNVDSSLDLKKVGVGAFYIEGNNIYLGDDDSAQTYAGFERNGKVFLNHNGIKRLETTGIGVSIYDDLNVGTAVTVYGNAGIVSATAFYGDGSNLTNTGASLSAATGTQRLVLTDLTTGTMVSAATSTGLAYDANAGILSAPKIQALGISTDGSNFGPSGYVPIANGAGGWNWQSVQGASAVNTILNGFTVSEEGVTVGTAGSITQLDFRGVNILASANVQPNGIATITMSETPTFQTLNVSGITTLGGPVTAGSSEGVSGQYLRHVGTGVTWANFPTLRTTLTTTATDNQTTFAFSYNVDFLDVFVNGIKLTPSEYTATNGTQIVLDSPAFAGDIIEFHSYNITSTYGGGGGGGGGGATLLDGLGDVTIGTLAEDQLLQYNSVNGQWENISAATVVGAATSFATKTATSSTATAGQTTFNGTYTVGFVDVYLNGSKLSEDQYTATSGTNIVLDEGASENDIVEVVGLTANVPGSGGGGSSYTNSDVDAHLNLSSANTNEVLSWDGSDYAWVSNSGGGGGLTDIVNDNTPQLGGNLDLNGKDITGTGSIDITGNLDVSGISTLSNVTVGGATTEMVVDGDLRVTGIITTGTGSVTINGNTNEIIVGTGVTIYGNTGIVSATEVASESLQFTKNNATVVGTSGTAGQFKQIGGAPFYYDGTAWREFALLEGTPVTTAGDTAWDNVMFRFDYEQNITDIADLENLKGNTNPINGGYPLIDLVASPVKVGSQSIRFSPSHSGVGWAQDPINYPNGVTVAYDFTGDWTMEGWVYFSDLPELPNNLNPAVGSAPIFSQSRINYNDNWVFGVHFNGTGTPGGETGSDGYNFYWYNQNSSDTSTGEPGNFSTPFNLKTTTGNALANTWNHVALVRKASDGSIHFYFNGVESSATSSNQLIDNEIVNTADAAVYFGFTALSNSDYRRFIGNLDDVRITTDERYTGNFTPPTTAHPITGTTSTTYTTIPTVRQGEMALGATPTWTGQTGLTPSQIGSGHYRLTFNQNYANVTAYTVTTSLMDYDPGNTVVGVGITRYQGYCDFIVTRASDSAAVDTGSLAVNIYKK